jgi:hypothetical protein
MAGVIFLRKDGQQPTKGKQMEAKTKGSQIVVLDRGFVYQGNVTTLGDEVTIENAKNIRRWGTTKGLGELAAKGPQPNTVLDEAGTVTANSRAVIHFIKCNTTW